MSTKSSHCVITNENGEVLLILREDARIWALPAGGVEAGETWEQAALREAKEETGFDVVIERWVGEYRRPQLSGGKGDLARVFAARVTGGDTSQHDWESLQVSWFPANALPKNMFRFSREMIYDTLTGSADSEPLYKEQKMPLAQVFVLRVFFVLRNLRNWLRKKLKPKK